MTRLQLEADWTSYPSDWTSEPLGQLTLLLHGPAGAQGHVYINEAIRPPLYRCEDDVRTLKDRGYRPSRFFYVAGSKLPKHWRSTGTRRVGLGIWLYETAFDMLRARYKGTIFVGADLCEGGWSSRPVRRLWDALARKYPSSGYVLALESTKGQRLPPRPPPAGFTVARLRPGEAPETPAIRERSRNPESVGQLEARLLRSYPLQSLILSERPPGGVRVDTIRIVQTERGAGAGRDVMKEIVAWADRTGTTLVLTPAADWDAASPERAKRRLTRWYKTFGFVPNKGRRKDFRFTDTMIRHPARAQNPQAEHVRSLTAAQWKALRAELDEDPLMALSRTELPSLGEGIVRRAYLLEVEGYEPTVLKVDASAGFSQTASEVACLSTVRSDLLPRIYDWGPPGRWPLWVEVERLWPVTEDEFAEATGVTFEDFGDALALGGPAEWRKRDADQVEGYLLSQSQDFGKVMRFSRSFAEVMTTCRVSAVDLRNLDNWGRDRDGNLKIVDLGMAFADPRDVARRLFGPLFPRAANPSSNPQRPAWFDARFMKVVEIEPDKILYHGTSSVLPPAVVPRQWVGPWGFYVTPLRDVAESYARNAEVRFTGRTGLGRVLEFRASDLGLRRLLVVSREPTADLVREACAAGYDGIWGPRLWGIFACGVDPADALMMSEVPPAAITKAQELLEQYKGRSLVCGIVEVVEGWWIEVHTLGCRNAADDPEEEWWDRHWEIYQEYRGDGVSVVLGDPADGVFVTMTKQLEQPPDANPTTGGRRPERRGRQTELELATPSGYRRGMPTLTAPERRVLRDLQRKLGHLDTRGDWQIDEYVGLYLDGSDELARVVLRMQPAMFLVHVRENIIPELADVDLYGRGVPYEQIDTEREAIEALLEQTRSQLPASNPVGRQALGLDDLLAWNPSA